MVADTITSNFASADEGMAGHPHRLNTYYITITSKNNVTMNEWQLHQQRYTLRLRALERIAHDLMRVVSSPRPPLVWLGTQRDLVEMVHLTWQQQPICPQTGLPYTRQQLAREAFAAVGRRCTPYVNRIVYQLSQRADARLSVVERYICLDHEADILPHFVAHADSSAIPSPQTSHKSAS